MKYNAILPGIFRARPNRFIAYIEIQGKEEVCHVKNTGRCKELLIPGARVYVQDHGEGGTRKTRYSLIAVMKGNRLINMDSQAPNKVAAEWISQGGLLSEVVSWKAEQRYGNSRFDLYVETKEKKYFIEVKGVTLEENGVVRFPDAPTQRGVKHVEELCHCVQEGYGAYILFVIQMQGVDHFEPNYQTHEAFGEALVKAQDAGVKIVAVDCKVEEDTLTVREQVPVILSRNEVEENA